MECRNYNCKNDVMQENSVLCPVHIAELATARDQQYVSYCKACLKPGMSGLMHSCGKFRALNDHSPAPTVESTESRAFKNGKMGEFLGYVPSEESTQAISGWVDAGESGWEKYLEENAWTFTTGGVFTDYIDLNKLKSVVRHLLSQQRREMIERVERLEIDAAHVDDEVASSYYRGFNKGLDAALAILKENL